MKVKDLIKLLSNQAPDLYEVTARGMVITGIECNTRRGGCDIKFEPYEEKSILLEDVILDWAEDNNVKHPELFAEHMKQYASEQLGLELPQ